VTSLQDETTLFPPKWVRDRWSRVRNLSRVARCICKKKIKFGYILEDLEIRHIGTICAIDNILQPLDNFKALWYNLLSFGRFGMLRVPSKIWQT
jgi:hypothetical protein